MATTTTLRALVDKWRDRSAYHKARSREHNHAGQTNLDAYNDGKHMALEECIADLLASLGGVEGAKLSDNPLTAQLLDLITLMPDSQTDEIVTYITELRAIRQLRHTPAPPEAG